MKREITRAPPLSKLHPVKGALDLGPDAPFPVYKNLADTLALGQDQDTIRHVCAVLAAWAYSDTETVSSIMGRMGLENNVCRCVAVENNAMLICSTSYLVQSACGRVVLLAYRGTDPFNLATWAADADVNPALVPVPARAGVAPSVHGGFYRNQRATWFDVIEGLQGAATTGSILAGLEHADPPLTGGQKDLATQRAPGAAMQSLYITGHSLGAAMATLAAFKLATEKEYQPILGVDRLKGVHCFAPPMVGNADFARQCEDAAALKGKISSYIFQNDIVPHLPPVKGFVHFGKTFVSQKPDSDADPSRYEWKEFTDTVERAPVTALGDAAVRLVGDLTTVNLLDQVVEHLGFLGLVGKALNGFVVSLRGRRYSFYDHAPSNYVACSQPNGVTRTEFGNDF